MLGQELQDPDELPHAGPRPEHLLQDAAKVRKRRGQLPVAVHRGVIQRRRLAFRRDQIMQGIEHRLAVAVTALVAGHHLARGHDREVLDVALHGHGPERPAARHPVGVVVEAHGLILVHLGGV
jgi:hypothetical protein